MDQIGLVELAGIGALVVFIVWMIAFFGLVRPRIMEGLAKRLNVEVRESTDALDAGSFEVEGKAPLAKHGAIWLADVAVVLAGTVGVCALISVPGFLVAEGGAPYRWESILLKTGVRVVSTQIPPMRDGKTQAIIVVQSESDTPMSGCQVSTDGYTASNGYLTGSSAFFDLTPQQAREVRLDLSATSPNPGDYDVVLKLECKNRVKEKITTRISVGS